VLSVGLFNLLDNAIRFPRRGDKVELMAEEDEGAVV
jgi:K+-sensing histidine kinase KdpD